MTVAQVSVLYLLLMGLAHRSQIDLGASDAAVRAELDKLVRGWLDGDLTRQSIRRQACAPPSTTSTWPLMNSARSLARNTAARAM